MNGGGGQPGGCASVAFAGVKKATFVKSATVPPTTDIAMERSLGRSGHRSKDYRWPPGKIQFHSFRSVLFAIDRPTD